MHESKQVFEPDHFTHSFALQYIALILFILIFSISAFLPKTQIARVSPPPPQEPVVTPIAQIALASVPLTDVFSGSSHKKLNGIPGFIELLKQHDVNARIDLFWGKSIGFATAVHRGNLLLKEIEAEKIPATSIRLSLIKSDSALQGEITLKKGANE